MEAMNWDRHRAVVTGSIAAAALTWALWKVDPTASSSPLQPAVITVALIANIGLTIALPRRKRALVAVVQRYLLNPVVRLLFRIGIVPFGYALLETRGRTTGLPRCTPVGNGLCDSAFWIIAEHGLDAGYVRNLMADPRVRIKLRRGMRFVWVDALATVTDDDPMRRQRELCGWRPLRLLNAIVVRTLATDPVAVRVEFVDSHDRQAVRPR